MQLTIFNNEKNKIKFPFLFKSYLAYSLLKNG